MSSFLDDLNTDDTGGTSGANPKTNGNDSPFLVGLQQSDEFAGADRKKNTGLIALLIALTAAAGGLYAMRTVGLSANVALAGTEIDYAARTSAAAVDHEQLIADLHRSDNVVQVPVTQLPINPFAWNAIEDKEPEPEPEKVVEQPRINPEEQARRERERQINQTFGMLTLDSVLNGRRPVVRISGEIYTLGDTVEEFFTIQSVTGRSVTLDADGTTYTLRLQE